MSRAKNTEQAWFENPNVLMRSLELFPLAQDPPNQQLNAMTRLLLLITLVVFAFTRSIATLLLGASSAAGLAYFFQSFRRKQRMEEEEKKKREEEEGEEEGFQGGRRRKQKKQRKLLEEVRLAVSNPEGLFQTPTEDNPFGNLLLSDAARRPSRLPAVPIKSASARHLVHSAMKRQVEKRHPDVAARMFATSADQYQFQQSLLPFFTQPVTTIINDADAAYRFLVPNTGAWRDGDTRLGSKFRPRFKGPEKEKTD